MTPVRRTIVVIFTRVRMIETRAIGRLRENQKSKLFLAILTRYAQYSSVIGKHNFNEMILMNDFRFHEIEFFSENHKLLRVEMYLLESSWMIKLELFKQHFRLTCNIKEIYFISK